MDVKKSRDRSKHTPSTMKHKKMKHKRKKRMKRLRLLCPLCSENKEIAHMSISSCGHVFCTRCLHAALAQDVACPTCGQKIMKRKRRFQDRFKLPQLPAI